jgi:uncharacterized protein (UPF0335 family)
MTELETKLATLQSCLLTIDKVDEQIEELKKKFPVVFEKLEHLENNKKEFEAIVKNIEKDIKSGIAWEHGQDKTVYSDIVKIREDKTETVNFEYEENEAVDYAIKHEHFELLRIDKPKFEKLAETLDLDFVDISIERKFKVTISKPKLKKLKIKEDRSE